MLFIKPDRRQRWVELATLLDRLERGGWDALTVAEAKKLCWL